MLHPQCFTLYLNKELSVPDSSVSDRESDDGDLIDKV